MREEDDDGEEEHFIVSVSIFCNRFSGDQEKFFSQIDFFMMVITIVPRQSAK